MCNLWEYVEIENYKDLVTRPTTFTFFATLPGKQNEDYYKVRYESSQSPFDFDENIVMDK